MNIIIKELKGIDKNGKEIWRDENGNRICSAKDCEIKYSTNGYCVKHYKQVLRHGKLCPELEINKYHSKKCMVDGCENDYYGLGYCIKHHDQFVTFGKILERTRFDKNEFIKTEEYYEIVLYDVNTIECKRTKIDLDDYERTKDVKWHYSTGNGYVYGTIDSKRVALHRYINSTLKGMVVDHKNHDILDNRKANLRNCTFQENSMNKKMPSNNTSGFTGVCWSKDINKWSATIQAYGKSIVIGNFDEKSDAIKFREEAENKYFGEFIFNKIYQ